MDSIVGHSRICKSWWWIACCLLFRGGASGTGAQKPQRSKEAWGLIFPQSSLAWKWRTQEHLGFTKMLWHWPRQGRFFNVGTLLRPCHASRLSEGKERPGSERSPPLVDQTYTSPRGFNVPPWLIIIINHVDRSLIQYLAGPHSFENPAVELLISCISAGDRQS